MGRAESRGPSASRRRCRHGPRWFLSGQCSARPIAAPFSASKSKFEFFPVFYCNRNIQSSHARVQDKTTAGATGLPHGVPRTHPPPCDALDPSSTTCHVSALAAFSSSTSHWARWPPAWLPYAPSRFHRSACHTRQFACQSSCWSGSPPHWLYDARPMARRARGHVDSS